VRPSLGALVDLWQVAAAANGVIAVAYLCISATIGHGLMRGGQLRTNRLGLATTFIFATCGLGHLAHLSHITSAVAAGPVAMASLSSLYDWHLVVVDGVTAMVAIWYWTLRSQYRALLGVSLFTDIDAHRRQAVLLHDAVVQDLAAARYALQLHEPEASAEALERALDRAIAIVGDLLPSGEAPLPVAAGRGASAPAGPVPTEPPFGPA
jgi:signal transduction histidine kinase